MAHAAPKDWETRQPVTAVVDLRPVDQSGVRGVARLKGFPASDNTLVQMRVTGLAPKSVHAACIHPAADCVPCTHPCGTCRHLNDLRANAQGIAFTSVMAPSASIIGSGAQIHVHTRACQDPAGAGSVIARGDLSGAGARP
jgi:hypothetical protein